MDYEKNSLLAVSSLYGVDILLDNVQICRDNLYQIWEKQYKAVCKRECSDNVKRSIRFILERNIVCGNALTLMTVDENGKDTDVPIIFSEWAFVMGMNIQRQDFTFEKLMNQAENAEQQLSLGNEDEGTLIQRYICDYRRIWENG